MPSPAPASLASLVVLVDKVGTPRKTFEFHRSPVRIGRGEENDVHLPLAFVSDVHAEIEFDERGARYIDLGSTNGSFVTGKRIPARLPIAIEESLAVEIGALRLTIARHKDALARTADPLSPPTIFPLEGGGLLGGSSAIAGELGGPLSVTVPREEADARPAPGGAPEGQGEAALALCRAVIRLRRAYDRCGREMGVRPFLQSRGAQLHTLEEPAELLAALSAGQAGRDQLELLVADMATHHDAMLAAITAGAHAALKRAGAFDDATGDLEAALFGTAFAEAYATGRSRASGD